MNASRAATKKTGKGASLCRGVYVQLSRLKMQFTHGEQSGCVQPCSPFMKSCVLTALLAAAILSGASAAEPKRAPAKKNAATPTPAPAPAPTEKKDAPAPKDAAEFAPKDPVAVVNGMEVTVAELEKVLTAMLSEKGGSIKEVPPAMKPQLYRQVLDGVIVEKLVTAQASKVEVNDAEVAAEFDRFKGRFPDEKTMEAQLAASGQTPDGVKTDIRRFLKQNHWLDTQLTGKLEVTEADAEKFFSENPEQFKAPEQVRASHILVSVKEGSKDDEVKAKRDAADKILTRVKKGEAFDKLATELSEDPSAKENHGDLNFFGREQMVPEFSEAAFKLKKGEISPEPVRSNFGFHIIKVTDRKEPSTMTFPEVKPQLMAYLQQQKKQNETGRVLRGLREGAEIKVNLPDAE